MKRSEAEAYFKARIVAAEKASQSGDPRVANQGREDAAFCKATLVALGIDQFEPEDAPFEPRAQN